MRGYESRLLGQLPILLHSIIADSDTNSHGPYNLTPHNLPPLFMTYTQATQRLQEIVASLESGTLDIDKLAAQIKEAQQLLAFCKERLTATSQELENILNNEQE